MKRCHRQQDKANTAVAKNRLSQIMLFWTPPKQFEQKSYFRHLCRFRQSTPFEMQGRRLADGLNVHPENVHIQQPFRLKKQI